MATGNPTEIRITGTVQGVGFRPKVWRLACEEGLVGEVLNDSAGLLIRTTGELAAIARLVERLQREAPPLSRIESVEVRRLSAPLAFSAFSIAESAPGDNRTRTAPDAATCAACRDELLSPTDRRSGYPFANCTHCGPRFSIVRAVPYDRARTTMADFPMCEACAAEYADPTDRRFHAQPIACPTCGPQVWLEHPASRAILPRGEAINAAVRAIEEGQIVAVRGLGGFHLACDATSAAAVERLRSRKQRYGKPFALMAPDLATIERYCRLSPLARRLLESPEAPVVLLRADGPEPLPEPIAPRLDLLGFMLPYTPLHLLMMQKLGRPVVMTSGNVSHEPQVIDNDEARSKLSSLADVMLLHDRDIANRLDDSVIRVIAGKSRMLRRARGYAPGALALPEGFEAPPDLLAYGGELKSTFCLVKEGAAVVSQHQGDLEDLSTFEDYQKNLRLYASMYDHTPVLLAADRHPEYLSTKLALERAESGDLELIQIQHHHAHVASCLAENGVARSAPAVLGVTLDGLGFGDDGTLWGGEFLLADYRAYRRIGALTPVAMPGGVQAIHQPWRSLYAHIAASMGWSTFAKHFASTELFHALSSKPRDALDRMMARGLNSPLASSCGRLFDAVAAALGMCSDHADDEAQGAMELEAAAGRCPAREDLAKTAYPFAVTVSEETGFHRLDAAPMWWALFRDLREGTPAPVVAARFHHGLAASVAAMVQSLRKSVSFTTVALSGGCFQNAILLEEVLRLVEAQGLRCLSHEKVPTNDGGLSLGQAAIAAARSIRRKEGIPDHAG